MRRFCLDLLHSYRTMVSPFLGPACRFQPTCSQYATDAVTRYGVIRGCGLAIIRLMKCHPFHPGGDDPVR